MVKCSLSLDALIWREFLKIVMSCGPHQRPLAILRYARRLGKTMQSGGGVAASF
jgi:hypothetical protein